ncbi:11818_t:CDS:2 [Ambispora gerdemannii]|uniref:11818_t:CDS:1 n=1 Tax=Ambispora gerdemannii TaxID=144530 RepID=A0A9N9B6V0_9GLOM|nr:11818_t:CDS:2 [Ambispora gerdemannii]
MIVLNAIYLWTYYIRRPFKMMTLQGQKAYLVRILVLLTDKITMMETDVWASNNNKLNQNRGWKRYRRCSGAFRILRYPNPISADIFRITAPIRYRKTEDPCHLVLPNDQPEGGKNLEAMYQVSVGGKHDKSLGCCNNPLMIIEKFANESNRCHIATFINYKLNGESVIWKMLNCASIQLAAGLSLP